MLAIGRLAKNGLSNEGHCYYGMFENLDLGDFRCFEGSERQSAIKALKDLWRSEGARMKEAAKVAGPLCKQPVETRIQWSNRWFSMTDEEQNIAYTVMEPQANRREINQAIKHIRDGKWLYWIAHSELPSWMPKDSEAAKVFQPILDRYKAAHEAGMEKRTQEILATPIDDQAWEAELKKRARCEYEREHPEIFVIRI
jgi:hypothetical protein